MPRKNSKRRAPYAKPLSLFPLTPGQALANILAIPPKDAERIRGVSAMKLRAWRIPRKEGQVKMGKGIGGIQIAQLNFCQQDNSVAAPNAEQPRHPNKNPPQTFLAACLNKTTNKSSKPIIDRYLNQSHPPFNLH